MKPHWGMACTLLTLCLVLCSAMAHSNPAPSQLTPTRVSHPARRPQWLVLQDKLFLLWTTPVDVEHPVYTSDKRHTLMPVSYRMVATPDGLCHNTPVKEMPITCDLMTQPYLTFACGNPWKDQAIIYVIQSWSGDRETDLRFAPLQRTLDAQLTLAITAGATTWYPPRKTSPYPNAVLIYPEDKYYNTGCVAPDIWVEETRVVIAGRDRWNNKGLFVTDSTDHGTSWGDPLYLEKRANWPTVALSGGAILLAAIGKAKVEGGYRGMPVNRGKWPDDFIPRDENSSPPHGKLLFWRLESCTQQQPSVVLDEHEFNYSADLAVAGQQVYLVYAQMAGKSRAATRIMLLVSPDGGNTWGKPQALTDGTSLDREPCAVVYQNELWVAYSRSFQEQSSTIHCVRVPLK